MSKRGRGKGGCFGKSGQTGGIRSQPSSIRGGRQDVPNVAGSGSGSGGPEAVGSNRPALSSTSPSVDPKVTNQEDENIKKSSGPPSNMEAQLARRPGYGQEGTHVALFANYFRVNASKDLYLYAVEMEPEVKIRDHRKMVYTELFKQLGEAMRKAITTDYSKQIVASCILGPLKDSYSIEYTPSHNTAVGKRSIKLTLKLSSTISVSMLHRYLSGDDDTYNESQAIQALNIILARVPSSSENCVCKGSKFFPRDQTDLETFKILSYIPGVVAVKGYYSSVRTSTSRLLCNINICTSAFYEPAALHMAIRNLPEEEYDRFLRGLRVTTDYIKNEKGVPYPKYHRIMKVSPPSINARAYEFDNGNGGSISVELYFLQHYGIKLQHPLKRLVSFGLIKGTNTEIYVPMELCTVVFGQPYRSDLPIKAKADMIKFAAQPPDSSKRLILSKGLRALGHDAAGNTALSSDFGIEFSSGMIGVQGRVLPFPCIKYDRNNKSPDGRASWNLANQKFNKCNAIARDTMAVLVVGRRILVDWTTVRSAVDKLVTMCRREGLFIMKVPSQTDICYLGPEPNNFISTYRAFIGNKTIKYKIALVVFAETTAKHYAYLKYCCDVEFGIHTVCVKWENFGTQRVSDQFLANLSMKLNCKNGGKNHLLTPAVETAASNLKAKQTIILGIDVTHPGAHLPLGTPSIAAVVGSIDSDFVQWPASLRLQEGKVEIVAALTDMIYERLCAWKAFNSNEALKSLIIYRDGVSEGQYLLVLQQEGPKIRAACQRFDPRNTIKITIIIVGKRHHTRFYWKKPGTEVENPSPGLVVDRGVTGVYLFDFYLQSHMALKGCARPAHYVVIKDENNFTADGLQKFTNGLCYQYVRSTCAVSICPAAYYADKACDRGRCYLWDRYHALKTSCPADKLETKAAWEDAEKTRNFQSAQTRWGAGVHTKLRHSMFYI